MTEEGEGDLNGSKSGSGGPELEDDEYLWHNGRSHSFVESLSSRQSQSWFGQSIPTVVLPTTSRSLVTFHD